MVLIESSTHIGYNTYKGGLGMLTSERHRYILEELNEKSSVKLTQLAEEMKVSESTVRRDLSALEDEGLLTRIHGGAQRKFNIAIEASMQEKEILNLDAKNRIAHAASLLVEDGDCLFIDAGTTTLAMIAHLGGYQDLLVVTNGISQADYLSQMNIETILLGGRVRPNTGAIVGETARQQLASYHCHKAFLGINGVDYRYGLTTPKWDEAVIKQQANKQSIQTFILADSTKFDKVTFTKVFDINEGIIITEHLSHEMKLRYEAVSNIKEVN
ncbi:DeoR family transcriptional regulator [Suicoccus acidiformans]|uniref:DeoR family transcriptional regulator n=2 Tax=Suicoccus acidiformans TaxID=2036206 RepID=A0A347WNH4_9LACT|nr:DeoR family transcriptional regulator [Suicoccus acidiformans]